VVNVHPPGYNFKPTISLDSTSPCDPAAYLSLQQDSSIINITFSTIASPPILFDPSLGLQLANLTIPIQFVVCSTMQ